MVLYLSRSGVVILPRRSLSSLGELVEVALRSFVATVRAEAREPEPEPEPAPEPEPELEPDDGIEPTCSFTGPSARDGYTELVQVYDHTTAELVDRGIAGGFTTGAPGMFYEGGLQRAVTIRLGAARDGFNTDDPTRHRLWRQAANLVYLARDVGAFGVDHLGNAPFGLRALFSPGSYVERP